MKGRTNKVSVSLDMDVNTILNAVAALGGLVAALIGWFCVRPANKKLAVVEASLQRNNESVASMRNALLDSTVRIKEMKYAKLEESCEAVYRSFVKVFGAASGLLLICAGMKDLDEIRKTMQRENKLDRVHDWLGLFVKDEMLVPIQPADLSIAEIYVPDRVWKLYNAANSLYASAIMQMATLKNGLDVQLEDRKSLYAAIEQVIPGQGKILEEFGTTGYRSVMGLIKTSLLNEIRVVLENEPITASVVVDVNERFQHMAGIPTIPEDLKSVVS